MQDAPVLLLVYVLLDGKYPLEKDLLGVGACVQNVLLVAAEQGYGSCVIGELYGKGGGATENGLLVCGITIGKEAL